MSYICGRAPCPSPGCPYCTTAPIYSLPPIPMGCICPPTSEKTCENGMCPRKNHLRASGNISNSPAVRALKD